jgi:hypothetical protein
MTPIEIINETAKFYGNDVSRRSLTETGGCKYNGPNGKYCAIARCTKNPSKIYEDTSVTFDNQIKLIGYPIPLTVHINTILKEEYKGMPEGFWKDLQEFHDEDYNWNAYGISLKGMETLDYLREKYSRLTVEYLFKNGFSKVENIMDHSRDTYRIQPEGYYYEIWVHIGDYPQENPNCGVVGVYEKENKATIYNEETEKMEEIKLEANLSNVAWGVYTVGRFKKVYEGLTNLKLSKL